MVSLTIKLVAMMYDVITKNAHSDPDSTHLPLLESTKTSFGGIFARSSQKCILGNWTMVTSMAAQIEQMSKSMNE